MGTFDTSAFSFDEADHLTRIHLKLALEDVGFVVEEAATTIRIGLTDDEPATQSGGADAVAIGAPPPPR